MRRKSNKFHRRNNPFKVYRQRHSTLERSICAQQCRAQRLANPTRAEIIVDNWLLMLGVGYHREEIIFYDDTFLLLDFYLPTQKLCIEVDGGYHKLQKTKDAGRDAYLRSVGIETIRFTNQEVISGKFLPKLKARLLL